jgi:hypothetical protein
LHHGPTVVHTALAEPADLAAARTLLEDVVRGAYDAGALSASDDGAL